VKDRDTLVLGSQWEKMKVCTVKRIHILNGLKAVFTAYSQKLNTQTHFPVGLEML
jgi:hypothetical protein